MKRTELCLAAFLMAMPLCAQSRHQSGANHSMLVYPMPETRTEIIIPEVNGYQVVKADLHVHTIYSDGNVTPSYRVREAWADGLDAIAITDHIEYRPCEKKMMKFLSGNVTKNEVEKGKIASDLNFPVENAQKNARHMGITLIPGVEITRDPVKVGHFNALFTTDNNLIYDRDPLQSIRNARKQGAIIEHNHPGWRKPDNEYTAVMEAAMAEGLVDGVEIFNSEEFYPDVIEKAAEKGFFVAGGSDIHAESSLTFSRYGVFRNMTLIFAKDSSAGSIREALEHGRTLAYGYGDIAGKEDLLKDFLAASLKVKMVYSGSRKYYRITNATSFPLMISVSGSDPFVLGGLSSVQKSTSKDEVVISVANMWYGADKHPEMRVTLK